MEKVDKKIVFSVILTVIIIFVIYHFSYSSYSSEITNTFQKTQDGCNEKQEEIDLYLNLLLNAVCGLIYPNSEKTIKPGNSIKPVELDYQMRQNGRDWPLLGISMTGVKRLQFLEQTLKHIIANKIEGDFIECGVWRGGTTIFAQGIFKIYKQTNTRKVYVVDSFQGLPPKRVDQDGAFWDKLKYISVSYDQVLANFKAFNLLADNVVFVKGFFADSLPTLPSSLKLSVFRLDGDMYSSTMDQLFYLYDKLVIGGTLIIDDFNIAECRKAIEDFRSWHNIHETIKKIDIAAAYWVKEKHVLIQMNLYYDMLKKV